MYFFPTVNIWATLENSNTNLTLQKAKKFTCNWYIIYTCIKREKNIMNQILDRLLYIPYWPQLGTFLKLAFKYKYSYVMHTQYTYKYWDQSLYFWRTYKNVEVYNGFAFHVAVSLTGTGLTLIKTSPHTLWGGDTPTHCIRCQEQAHSKENCHTQQW